METISIVLATFIGFIVGIFATIIGVHLLKKDTETEKLK